MKRQVMLELKDQEVNHLPSFANFSFFLVELKFYHCCLEWVNFHNYKRGDGQAYLSEPSIVRRWDYATMRDYPWKFGVCNTTGHLLYLKYLYTGQFVKIWAQNSHWKDYNWLSTSKKSTGKWGKYFAILYRNDSQ